MNGEVGTGAGPGELPDFGPLAVELRARVPRAAPGPCWAGRREEILETLWRACGLASAWADDVRRREETDDPATDAEMADLTEVFAMVAPLAWAVTALGMAATAPGPR
jgi:hypothetical protein